MASIIWILGEFGEKIENSPYIIENIIDKFDSLQSQTIIYAVIKINFNYNQILDAASHDQTLF